MLHIQFRILGHGSRCSRGVFQFEIKSSTLQYLQKKCEIGVSNILPCLWRKKLLLYIWYCPCCTRTLSRPDKKIMHSVTTLTSCSQTTSQTHAQCCDCSFSCLIGREGVKTTYIWHSCLSHPSSFDKYGVYCNTAVCDCVCPYTINKYVQMHFIRLGTTIALHQQLGGLLHKRRKWGKAWIKELDITYQLRLHVNHKVHPLTTRSSHYNLKRGIF